MGFNSAFKELREEALDRTLEELASEEAMDVSWDNTAQWNVVLHFGKHMW